MKKISCLFLGLFTLLFFELPAQNCQLIIAEVSMSSPPVSPPDIGYIDICAGDVVTFTGSGIFPENDLYYHQDDVNSTFTWILGDGHTKIGQTIEHIYEEPGGYKVQLEVKDSLGCESGNLTNLRIRVGGIPGEPFEIDSAWLQCPGDTISIQADYEDTYTYVFSSSLANTATLPIPDGPVTAMLSSSILIDEFVENLVVSDTTPLLRICVTMEHSWMYDLEISLLCPDSTQIILQRQEFIPEEVFLGIPYHLDDDPVVFPPEPGIGYTYCWTPNASQGTWVEQVQEFNLLTIPEGDYSSSESFDNLMGCPLNGEWQLLIEDNWSNDNGYIFGWTLQFGTDLLQEPFFNNDVVDYHWMADPDAVSILTETDHDLEAIVNDSSDISLVLIDSQGCIDTFNLVTTVLETNDGACQPCNTFVADAGPDKLLTCELSFVWLDCGGSTSGEHINHHWFDGFGNLISDTCTVNIDEEGTYILQISSTANDCLITDTVEVFMDIELPIADAGPDNYLPCNSANVQIGGPGTTIGTDITYAWYFNNNLISNEAFPIVDQIGEYHLVVTNEMNGCISADSVNVTEELLLGLDITPTSCDVAEGMASVNVPSNVPDLQVNWSNGENGLQITDLAVGWYSVTVSDDTCAMQENFYVDEDISCKVQISGYVYKDHVNQDCVADNIWAGEECVLLHLMPLDIYTYSAPDGYYNFILDPGTYTIEILPLDYFELLCPASPTFTVELPVMDSISDGHDFYLKYTPDSYDLRMTLYSEALVPGFPQVIKINVCNHGESTVDATLTFTLDSLLTDFTTEPMYDLYDTASNNLTWERPGLFPGVCFEYRIHNNIPDTIELGTTMHFSAIVDPIDLDVIPSNNYVEWSQLVVAAYDPNDKQVLTGRNQFGGPIFRRDSLLQYQLRFQNIGTAPAQTVVIRDTLDQDLDVTTIRAGISSHDYVLEFEGNNVLIFRFDDIFLPDSTSNEPESHGFVSFAIELNDGLPLGTEIRNSAAIFFDFNSPVITNTVINTLTKLQYFSFKEVLLCEGEEYEEVTYFESTTLTDTLVFADFDSILVTEIEVFPSLQTTFDTTLVYGQSYQGNNYYSDTSFVQSLLSIAGCDSIVKVNIIVETVSINETTASEIQLQLYPNPVKEILQIQYQLPSSRSVSAYLYDVFGKELSTVISNQFQPVSRQKLEIPVDHLPAGLYLFVLETGSERYVEPFVKGL